MELNFTGKGSAFYPPFKNTGAYMLSGKALYLIDCGVNKTGDIRESLGVSPQLLNTYRKRLMERGVVDGSRHGELTLALPRFEEYINMYCEVTI